MGRPTTVDPPGDGDTITRHRLSPVPGTVVGTPEGGSSPVSVVGARGVGVRL